MKKIIFSVVAVFVLYSCTKQTVIDTGVPNGRFDGTMMEFLRNDTYNWDLTVKLIERAGLTDLFEGHVDSLKEITFLGFKSASIQRYLFDSQYKDSSAGKFYSVDDIPVGMARVLVLKHVINGRHLKDSIAFKNQDLLINDPRQTGGTKFTTVGGNRVWLYRENSTFAGVPGAGPITLSVYSITADRLIPMASPDLQQNNGIVHALDYGYEFGII
jgi:hypothetical protein